MRRFLIILIMIILCENARAQGEWLFGVVKEGGATVYKTGDPSADTLGRYPAGVVLNIQFPDEDGFYRVHFDKPWKGVQDAWLSAREIEVSESKPKPQGWTEAEDQFTSIYPKHGQNYLTIGLGVADIAYTQTIVPAYGEVTALLKLGFRSELSRYLELFAQVYGTYYSFATTRTDTGVETVGGFLTAGLNPFGKFPFKFFLVGGAGFSTLIASNNNFGYDPLIYPVIYPMIKWDVTPGFSFSLYFRYWPLSLSQWKSQREESAGGSI